MPIETDHPALPSRELYRFRPWFERPLTDSQVRACLVACWSVVVVIVVAGGAAVWVAGWPVRWLVEPILLLILLVLAGAGRDGWADSCAKCAPKMPWRSRRRVWRSVDEASDSMRMTAEPSDIGN